MSQPNNQTQALFERCCRNLDAQCQKYTLGKDPYTVETQTKYCGITFPVRIVFDEKGQCLSYYTTMPFVVPQDLCVQMSLAIAVANEKLACGRFNYVLSRGLVGFTYSLGFRECAVSDNFFMFGGIPFLRKALINFEQKLAKVASCQMGYGDVIAYMREGEGNV